MEESIASRSMVGWGTKEVSQKKVKSKKDKGIDGSSKSNICLT